MAGCLATGFHVCLRAFDWRLVRFSCAMCVFWHWSKLHFQCCFRYPYYELELFPKGGFLVVVLVLWRVLFYCALFLACCVCRDDVFLCVLLQVQRFNPYLLYVG